jgi:hypothetical protein
LRAGEVVVKSVRAHRQMDGSKHAFSLRIHT